MMNTVGQVWRGRPRSGRGVETLDLRQAANPPTI